MGIKRQALAAAAIGAFCSVGGLVIAQVRADTPTNPFAGDRAAAEAGRAIFEATCAACHGPQASGSERAPALNTGVFSRGNEPYDVFQVIHNGVPGTMMPSFSALPAEDIWRVVTYLASLSGGAVAAAPAAQAQASPAAIRTGERLFFGPAGCASCHEVNGRGAVAGVDLSASGLRGAAALRDALQHRVAPRFPQEPFRTADVRLRDGRRLSGIVRKLDSFTVNLQTPGGAFHLLDRSKVAEVKVSPPGGPRDLDKRLTTAQTDALIAYLSAQRGRDFKTLSKARLPPGLPYERIAAARQEPNNWLTYWGGYDGRHFSDLDQITPTNIAGLQAQWSAALPGESPLQATPLVVDGIMYVSGPPGDVYAFDARTGAQLWMFRRKQDVRNPYQINPTNRGVAVLGSRVFFNTLDNNLIALDARNGRPLWERRLADTMLGYTMTGAPLVIKDAVIVGMSGGEAGVRGFLEAYDPASGERLWRFDTIPGPGQPGNETWAGDSWKTGGGATWLTGSYDPELGLVYWTVGNPGPDFNPHVRAGDNLYTNTVLALDARTGKLVWHYQFTPNDSHDWDSASDLVLTEQVVDGKKRKLLLHADRNGFFYVLDRTNGQFLWAKNYVHQTWNAGFDAKGRPRVRPESVASPEGSRVFPAVGGTNFQAPSYDERTGLFYLAFQDAEGFSASADTPYQPGKLFWGRGNVPRPPPSVEPRQGIMALDSRTGEPRWTFPLTRNSLQAGVLATKGEVLFAGSAEGWFMGLDSRSGTPLWRFYAGGPITASPISYAVDGRQYVALAAGNSLLSFALPEQRGPAP
jgi:alcohol dehydrogenase (cytochrome c)